MKSKIDRAKQSSIVAGVIFFATFSASVVIPIEWFKVKISDFYFVWGGGGDSLLSFSFVQSLATGRFPINPHFGAPSGLNWGYYPVGDWTEASIAAIFDRMLNIGAGLPIIFLLSFPITYGLSYLVFREVKVTSIYSSIGALSFTLIPWHFYRLGHLFLATTYGCVAGALFVFRIFLSNKSKGRKEVAINSVLLITAGLSGVYYAAFTLILLIIATIWRFLRERKLVGLIYSSLFVVMAILGQIPFYFALAKGQSSSQVSGRHPIESIIYGGKLLTLLLPFSGTRLPLLHHALRLESLLPADSEAELPSNYGTTITFVCFILLTLYLFWRLSARNRSTESPALSLLPVLIITLLGFFISYGPNLFFAVLITPQIRAWNRLTPLLDLLVMVFGFSLIGELSDRFSELKLIRTLRRGKNIYPLLLILIVILDQTPALGSARGIIDQGIERTKLANQYLNQLDSKLPAGCTVLELPIVPFPENPPIYKLADYELMFPALLDRKLNWSYGAMKNTPSSAPLNHLQRLGIPDLVKVGKGMGYCAVHYDSRGFEDDKTFQQLEHYLGKPIAVGFDKQWFAFRL
jgi:phosphoglycerol transferase